jgi:uncharacterized hydrophobic protein (TIGR00271 family)
MAEEDRPQADGTEKGPEPPRPPADSGSDGASGQSPLQRWLQASDVSAGQLVYNPLVVRGAVAIVLALLLLIGFELRGPLMRVALPVGLIAYVLTRLWELWRVRKTEAISTRRWATLLAALGLAIFFLLWPEATVSAIALAVAIGFVFTGVSNLVDAVRHREDSATWSWMAVKGGFMVGIGVLVFAFPANMLTTAFLILMFVWIAGGIIAIVYGLRGTPEQYDSLEPSAMLMEWLSQREYSSEDRHNLTKTLFFEGADRVKRINRFAALMAFSVIIATLGVLQDSTAVVIGAMLIAPLMTPIMALAAAITLGWRRRAATAAVTIALAVAGAILLATAVALFAPVVGDALQSSQVTSRTSPTLLDLLVALTAGAAGAFAMSRPDVSDSLPGVAIAVALVPPLGVVGVTLAGGDWSGAAGSFLLFLTNFVSIVIAGSIVFILTGVSPLFRLKQKSSEIRVALGTFAVVALIIAIPLSITGQQLWNTAQTEKWTGQALDEWFEAANTEYSLDEVTVAGDEIDVIVGIEGGKIPEIEELATRMAENGVQAPFTVTVRFIPEERTSHFYDEVSTTVDDPFARDR